MRSTSPTLDRGSGQTSAARMGLMLAWLYLVLLGGTWAIISSFAVRVLSLLLLIGIVGGWVALQAIRRAPILPSVLDTPIAGFLLAAALATVFSVAPRLSGEALALYGGYALCFVFLAWLAKTRGRDLHVLLVVTSVTVALAGLVERLLWYFGLAPGLGYQVAWPAVAPQGELLPPVLARASFVTGNPNILAGFLVPWLPFAAQMALGARPRSLRLLAVAWFAVLALAVLSTLSRGSFLAALAGLSFLALAHLALRHGRALLEHLAGWRPKLVLGIGSSAILAMVAWRLLPRSGLEGGSAGVRLELWGYALQMLAQRPLFGFGPDTFGLALLQMRPPSGRVEDFLPHPHNLYLGIAAELGAIGLIAALWLAYALGRGWWRGRPHDRAATGQWIAIMAGLVAMAAHGLVEDFRIYPLLVLQGIAFAALAVRHCHRAEGRRRALSPRWLILPGALLLLPVGYSTFTRWEVDVAARFAGSGHWPAAERAMAAAARHDSGIAFYDAQSGLARGWLASTGLPDADLPAAIADYRRAIEAEPFYAPNHANLAALLWQNGELQAAAEQMARAVELQPAEPRFRFSLAVYLDRLGDHSRASEELVTLLRDDPAILQSPAWKSAVRDAEQRELIAAVLGRLARGPEATRLATQGRIALATHDPGAAVDYFREANAILPSDFDISWQLGRALHRAGRLPESEAALRKAVGLGPGIAAAHAELAAVLFDEGSFADAAREAGTALFAQPNAGAHLVLARLAVRSGPSSAARQHYEAALPRSSFDVSYAYTAWRRPGLPRDILPQIAVLDTANEGAAFAEYADYLSAQGDFERAGGVVAQWMAYDPAAQAEAGEVRARLAETRGGRG